MPLHFNDSGSLALDPGESLPTGWTLHREHVQHDDNSYVSPCGTIPYEGYNFAQGFGIFPSIQTPGPAYSVWRTAEEAMKAFDEGRMWETPIRLWFSQYQALLNEMLALMANPNTAKRIELAERIDTIINERPTEAT